MHCVGVCAMAGHGQFLQCNLFFWLKIIYIYTLLGQVSWNTEDLQHHIIISKHVTYQNIKNLIMRETTTFICRALCCLSNKGTRLSSLNYPQHCQHILICPVIKSSCPTSRCFPPAPLVVTQARKQMGALQMGARPGGTGQCHFCSCAVGSICW